MTEKHIHLSDPKHLPQGPFGIVVTATKDQHLGAGHVYICDASGRKVASLWGPADQKIALADLIISARETV